jgi:hypothetical protein
MLSRLLVAFFIPSLLINGVHVYAQPPKVASGGETMQCSFSKNGTIQSITVDDTTLIQFRSDSLKGPALYWNNQLLAVAAQPSNGQLFTGSNQQLAYSVAYKMANNKLAISVTCTNLTNRQLAGNQLSLRLGINTAMTHYPQWDSIYFPTLLRAEATHFWGYFATPKGKVLTIASPDAIASYHLHYNNSNENFRSGHLIYTASIDLLNPLPLPARHPKNGSYLLPHEKRTWTIYLQPTNNISNVPSIIQQNTQAPTIQSNFYTLGKNETAHLTILSSNQPIVTVKNPDGLTHNYPVSTSKKGSYFLDFHPTNKEGMYTVEVVDAKNKKQTQALLSVRFNYSAYTKSARIAALKYVQKATSNTESWYGFFSAYIAQKVFPNVLMDGKVDKAFTQLYPLMYDTVTNLPIQFKNRIQNHAMMAALFAQKYSAGGKIADLNRAADLVDYLLSTQSKDGAYRNGGTHYTSVIYIAKAIMEVMLQEQRLKDTSVRWAALYQKQYASVKKAIDELAAHLDNIETEGEMTFEDGMISCSYTQIAQFALMFEKDETEKKRYTDAAITLLEKHRCLSQLLVPDSRMNGASLRFWEAQYDILSYPNMMTSPHGWSAWQVYGLKYLYELTNNYDYLRQMTNAIGTCIQLLNPSTDSLNWGFVADPYLQINYFGENSLQPGKGVFTKKTIGEQYLPMISGWYKPDPTKWATGYWGYDGGSGDNDVHEIFKCLGEVLLTTAYLHQLPNGELKAVNCTAQKTNDGKGITVIPNERCITQVHVYLSTPKTVTVLFEGKTISKKIAGRDFLTK